jgi:chromosome segregation ATPase
LDVYSSSVLISLSLLSPPPLSTPFLHLSQAKDKKIDKLLRDFNALSILKVEMGTQHKNIEQQVMDAEHTAEGLQKELDEREVIIRDQSHRIEDLETLQNRLKKENEGLTRRSSVTEDRLLQTIDQFTSEAQKMVEKYESVMREKEDEVNHLKIIVGQASERSEKSEKELEKVRTRLGMQIEQMQQEMMELSAENEGLRQETHDLEKHRTNVDSSTPKKKKHSVGERGFIGSDGEIIGLDEYQRLKIDLELVQKKLSTVETQLREKEVKTMRMHQRLNEYENGVRGLPEAQREIEYLESQIEFRERDLRQLNDQMNSRDEDVQRMKMQLLAVKEKYGEDAVALDLSKIKTGHDEELDRLRRMKVCSSDHLLPPSSRLSTPQKSPHVCD